MLTIFKQNEKEFLSMEQDGWFSVRRVVSYKGRKYASTETGVLLEIRKGRGKITLVPVPTPEAGELIPVLKGKLLKERERERQARKGA